MYAIISDVHSNLDALRAVIDDINKRTPSVGILFLGDIVGYGPEPNECIEIIKDIASFPIAGNHDWASVGLTDIEYFNPDAREAILWTQNVLRVEGSEFLKGLPLTAEVGDIFLVHGTPKEPQDWHYLIYLEDAEENFNYFKGNICFLGHSHIPFIIERAGDGSLRTFGKRAKIKSGSRYIINPGSVGQPRDRDPRASYAILKGDEVEIIRVAYPIENTQRKMKTLGLPRALIERLALGR